MQQKINKKKVVVAIFIIILCLVMLILNISKKKNKDTKYKEETNISEVTEKNEVKENLMNEEIKDVIEIPIVNEIKEEAKEPEKTQETEDPQEQVEPQEPEVPKENNTSNNERTFGNNVAFIGDSRTQAFLMYAGLNEVIDYTNVGLMVDTAVTKKFVKADKGEKVTILEDMAKRNIDTVYIMLGVNELGWRYSNIFIDKYGKLIDLIRQINPNCEILVQSIIPLTKTKSDNDDIYKNEKVKEYNDLLKEMAKEKNVKYIDVASVLSNNNGDLPEEASSDGVHLNKEYCIKWLDYLKKN